MPSTETGQRTPHGIGTGSRNTVIAAVVVPTRPRTVTPRTLSFAVEIPVPAKRPPRARLAAMAGLPYEVLDVAMDGMETTELCRAVMKLLSNARRIIVVAGAGISVAAGIPDFRSSTGLFSTLKADTKYKPSGKALFDASVYKVHCPATCPAS